MKDNIIFLKKDHHFIRENSNKGLDEKHWIILNNNQLQTKVRYFNDMIDSRDHLALILKKRTKYKVIYIQFFTYPNM